jgi:hypothetical protein
MISGTVVRFAQGSDLTYPHGRDLALGAKLHPSILRLGDPIHLAFAPDVVLELGDERRSITANVIRAEGASDAHVYEPMPGHTRSSPSRR